MSQNKQLATLYSIQGVAGNQTFKSNNLEDENNKELLKEKFSGKSEARLIEKKFLYADLGRKFIFHDKIREYVEQMDREFIELTGWDTDGECYLKLDNRYGFIPQEIMIILSRNYNVHFKCYRTDGMFGDKTSLKLQKFIEWLYKDKVEYELSKHAYKPVQEDCDDCIPPEFSFQNNITVYCKDGKWHDIGLWIQSFDEEYFKWNIDKNGICINLWDFNKMNLDMYLFHLCTLLSSRTLKVTAEVYTDKDTTKLENDMNQLLDIRKKARREEDKKAGFKFI